MILKQLSLIGVRRHVRVAQVAINFAIMAAKDSFESHPSRHISLGAAIWDALECRPGWSRTDQNSWTYRGRSVVHRQEEESFSSVFLSMLIVELSTKIENSSWKYELFEVLLNERKRQQIKNGSTNDQAEKQIAENLHVAAMWLALA